MRFLVHGSIAYDQLLSFDGSFTDAMDPSALEKLSVSYVMPHLERHHGGTGANIAWNLRLLDQEPLLVGAVGSDGGEYIDLLQHHGVNMTHTEKRMDAVTATAMIGTDSSERQIAFFHPGADGIALLPDTSKEKDVAYGIVSPRNPVRMLEAAAEMKKAGVPFLFDPGQLAHVFAQDEFRHAIQNSSGLVVNEYEWSLIQEKTGWEEADVLDACGLLIVTLGENGIRLVTKTEDVTVPACKIKKLVNPTGAGDAARVGLLVGLASGWSLADIGRLAAALASFVVEQEGTLLEAFDIRQLEERIEENYSVVLSL